MRLPVLALLAASLCAGQAAEEGKPASSNIMNAEYPKVYADLSAAFRLKAPDAQKVQVDIMAKKYDMTKGADGVWTVKIPPQVVGFHYYQFWVDSVNSFEAPQTVVPKPISAKAQNGKLTVSVETKSVTVISIEQ